MRRLTFADEPEIRELLAKYEFWMSNSKNDFKGEMTTLSEKDIDDIIGDFIPLFPFDKLDIGVIIEVDDNGKVIITYPTGVCKLESRGLRHEKNRNY